MSTKEGLVEEVKERVCDPQSPQAILFEACEQISDAVRTITAFLAAQDIMIERLSKDIVKLRKEVRGGRSEDV